MKKRIVALFLAMVMVSTLLVSCGQSGEKWDAALFEESSYKYNNELAKISAKLSWESESDTSSKIDKYYRDHEIIYYKSFNYGDSYASSISHQYLDIDGRNTLIITVTARGSQTPYELAGDFFKGMPLGEDTNNYLGRSVYSNVYHFQQDMYNAFATYISENELYDVEAVKILITGHSLGGAAANLFAANLLDSINNGPGWWNGKLSQEDIYVYTFGAITVFKEDDNLIEGYENIHNIYHYYDSFGPYGNLNGLNALTFYDGKLVSSPFAKFGHTDTFRDESIKREEDILSCKNHLMDVYVEALDKNIVKCEWEGIILEEETTKKTQEETTTVVAPTTAQTPEVESSETTKAPEIKKSNEFSLLGKWQTSDGVTIDFNEDGTFIFNWYGFPEHGTYEIKNQQEDVIPIELQGTNIIALMKLINGFLTNGTYGFEILVYSNDSIALVQVYEGKTAKSSDCKLPLKRCK